MKRNSIINATLALGVVAFTFCAATASAQDEGKKKAKDPAAMFDKADADSDGKVTQDEMKAANPKAKEEKLTAMFAAKDTDGDGMLSKDEFTAPGAEKKAKKKKGDAETSDQ